MDSSLVKDAHIYDQHIVTVEKSFIYERIYSRSFMMFLEKFALVELQLYVIIDRYVMIDVTIDAS